MDLGSIAAGEGNWRQKYVNQVWDLLKSPESLAESLCVQSRWELKLDRFSSGQFSSSIMSNSLRLHGLQHARLPAMNCSMPGFPTTTPPPPHTSWTVACQVQFISVQLLSRMWLFAAPWNRSMPGLPVHHQLPEFTQTHVHRVSDTIQLSHPLSSPSPPAPKPSQHQGLFQWVNSSHEVAKVLEFQPQHQSFQWTSRIDLL